MPKQVLTWRSKIARLAVLGLIASALVVGAVPAGAAIDTSSSCPSTIPSAGFTDISSFDALTQSAINCIAFYGITKGTSATTFDPNGTVTRWQMALFLTRQAVIHGLTLGDGSSQGFTDIGTLDTATQTAINQLKQLGITQGTSATTFDPLGLVPRWQMALFLTRLYALVPGNTLPSGASQGFTDIGTLDAATQTAINQAKQLGIADGTSATTFDPLSNTLRWHMALFLARTLAADGIVPTGLGNFVTAQDTANNKYTYANATTCATTTVAYKTTDSFFVNGAASTLANFEAALVALDFVGGTNNGTVVTGATSHNLTTAVKVNSGLIAFTGGTEIWEPVTGNVLSVFGPGAAFDFFSVDGANSTLTGYNDNLSAGDTLVVTGGDGTTQAKARTFALTNSTLAGTVDSVAGDVLTISNGCQLFDVDTLFPGGDTFTYTIGGTADTQANLIANATAGDSISYSRAAKKSTFALTNVAPPTVTGEAVANFLAPNFDVVVGSSVVTLDDTDDGSGNPWTTIVVNGLVADVADFEAALTPGDVITYRIPDADTSTTSRLTLTDAGYSGAPATLVGDVVTVYSSGISGPQLDGVDLTNLNPVGFSGNTAVTYTFNGATVTLAVFEANVNAAIANGNGTVSVVDSGTNTAWSLTTP